MTMQVRQTGEITAFTGLRGLAAWLVVAYHLRSEMPSFGILDGIVGNGEYAVDLFFVMSGFVLTLSYSHLFSAPASLRSFLSFLFTRIARIYPAHVITLLAYLSIPVAYALTHRPLPSNRYDPAYYVASVFLVQNWGEFGSLDWNIPAWSISTELQFYLCFPLIMWALRPRMNARLHVVLWGAGLALALAGLGYGAGQLVAEIEHAGSLRCLLECALGAWLFQAARPNSLTLAGSIGLTAGAVVLLGLFAWGSTPDYLVMPAAIVCLLYALLEPRNPLARLLSLPPLLWLGRISFSTYIVHYLVKDAVKLVVAGRASEWVVLCVYTVGVLAASVLMHYIIERPGQRGGRRLGKKLMGLRSRQTPVEQSC